MKPKGVGPTGPAPSVFLAQTHIKVILRMRWVTVLAELFGGTVTWMLMVTGRFALSPGLARILSVAVAG